MHEARAGWCVEHGGHRQDERLQGSVCAFQAEQGRNAHASRGCSIALRVCFQLGAKESDSGRQMWCCVQHTTRVRSIECAIRLPPSASCASSRRRESCTSNSSASARPDLEECIERAALKAVNAKQKQRDNEPKVDHGVKMLDGNCGCSSSVGYFWASWSPSPSCGSNQREI